MTPDQKSPTSARLRNGAVKFVSVQIAGLSNQERRRGSSVTRGRLGPELTPRYAPISVWCQISGPGRTITYEWLARKILRAVKAGNRTLIDVPHGLEYMANLPEAEITTGLRRRSAEVEDLDQLSSGAGDRAVSYRVLFAEREQHNITRAKLAEVERQLAQLQGGAR